MGWGKGLMGCHEEKTIPAFSSWAGWLGTFSYKCHPVQKPSRTQRNNWQEIRRKAFIARFLEGRLWGHFLQRFRVLGLDASDFRQTEPQRDKESAKNQLAQLTKPTHTTGKSSLLSFLCPGNHNWGIEEWLWASGIWKHFSSVGNKKKCINTEKK